MANEYETNFLPAVDKCFFSFLSRLVIGERRRKFGEYTTVSSNESVEWGIKKKVGGRRKNGKRKKFSRLSYCAFGLSSDIIEFSRTERRYDS